MRIRLTALLAIFGFAFGAPLWAHHSVQAVFDIHKTVSITGTVAKVEWINPHSYITVATKGSGGKEEHWAFEMAGPGALRKAGLSREDRGGLKPGDTVTISGLAAKDGSTTGFLQEITFPDGRTFKFNADANGN